jgi:hypothetical protein
MNKGKNLFRLSVISVITFNQTHNGTYLTNSLTWTGSDESGMQTGDNCNDWTDATVGYNGDFGFTMANTAWQNLGSTQPCNIVGRLYY